MRVKTIAEIGINHNGDIAIAKDLISIVKSSGCDYVKFQKRTPDKCVPEHQKNVMRETPWGDMTYLEYKKRIEFGDEEYREIDKHCEFVGIPWFVSVWDMNSIETSLKFRNKLVKIPSACITDDRLLYVVKATNIPAILSTGMSDMEIVEKAVDILDGNVVCIMHCVSTYPSKPEEQNMNCITTLKKKFPKIPIGFSNHFSGITYIPVAAALGAEWIEYHVTLDRAMWGTDQAASFEPEAVFRVNKYLRNIEKGMGDGEKRILEGEVPIMKKLRG